MRAVSVGGQVVGHSGLLQSANTSMLQQKLALRTPYVTPLNILQARLLAGLLQAVHTLQTGSEACLCVMLVLK